MTRERGHSSTGAARGEPHSAALPKGPPAAFGTLVGGRSNYFHEKSLGVTSTERVPGSIMTLPIKPIPPAKGAPVRGSSSR